MVSDKAILDLTDFLAFPISKDSPVPLYAQVQEILSNYILEKGFPDGTEFPTESQLCEAFQVSRITTKRALDELVREGLIRRVKGVGNFVSLSETVESPQMRSYGLIVDSSFDLFSNNFYSKVFQGIYESVHSEGGSLVFSLSDQTFSKHQGLPSMLKGRSLSGLLVLGSLNDAVLTLIRDQKIPTVLVDDDRPGFNRVITDNQEGAEKAVQFLTEMGHTRIGLVNSDRTMSFRGRTQGFIRAMKRAGLSAEPEWIKSVPGYDPDAGLSEFEEILQLPAQNRPSAIFAVNDHFAMNGIRAAHRLGLHIPEDISIMGFDDTPYATLVLPNLSTIRVQTQRMGEMAVTLLRRLMETRRSEVECLVLSTELIRRESVGALKPGSEVV
jgi:DNA-binding LacI/PurR family transcriptional regulator